ncbi:glycogen/starch synthase [Desulfoprunum benzoelyticum]|nr:glycogen/starch synthase [Desulfoprunum benzoelyticum]
MLTREYGEIAGAGGVKDVSKQLAESFAAVAGCDVRVVLPFYGFIDPAKFECRPLQDNLVRRPLLFTVDMNYVGLERREDVRVWTCRLGGVTVYLLESNRFREKMDVYTYTLREEVDESWKQAGKGHIDYFAMNVLLQKGALELMMLLDERPDVIHCHDGHTALVPALINECPGYRSYFRRTGCLVTIHNAGVGYHQEVADLPFAHAITGLPLRFIESNCLAAAFDPFLAAGPYALLNTVSENYARELQETDDDQNTGWLGHLLADRGVVIEGVTNGIDPADFNPSDPKKAGIAAAFDPADPADALAGKKMCKTALLDAVRRRAPTGGLEIIGTLENNSEIPLFTFIGRLSEQKGIDILIAALVSFLRRHPQCQMLFLGSGDRGEEERLRSLAETKGLAGRVCFFRGYSPLGANQVYAAGDFFVIPSRYEPCGLTDYIAQLFGSIPIVHHVGGLVKVVDGKTGIAYRGGIADLQEALERAIVLFGKPQRMRRMQRDAVLRIQERHTWDQVMKAYQRLYEKARLQRWMSASVSVADNPDLTPEITLNNRR